MRFKRLAIISLAALFLSALAPVYSAQQEDLTWLLGYRDKSENALAWDSRFAPFLKTQLPAVPLPSWFDEPVNQAAITFLGGVPGHVEVDKGRYLWASGCPAHSCGPRAMIWADTQSNTVVFVATGDEEENLDKATRAQYHIASAKLYLASLAPIAPDKLPDALRFGIVDWLHRAGVLNLSGISLLTPSGSEPITPDQLCWTGPCAQIVWN